MALAPITVQLSKWEQIEILRQEIELREEELKKTEAYIRTLLFEMERQRYLQSIHPLFQQMPPPAEAGTLPQIQANREALGAAIETMKQALETLEAETKGQQAPPSARGAPARPGAPAAPGAGASKRRFDSFDDFRSRQ